MLIATLGGVVLALAGSPGVQGWGRVAIGVGLHGLALLVAWRTAAW